jgi:hypothetical protein
MLSPKVRLRRPSFELKARLPAADIQAVGSLRLLLVCALLAGVVAGCGGSSDRGRYHAAIAKPLVRLNRASGEAVRMISRFERGRLSFREAATGVGRARRSVDAARRQIAAVEPPLRYVDGHRRFEHSLVLLAQALDAYDAYLHDFVAAVVAFRRAHAGEIQATEATARYDTYSRLFHEFQSSAASSGEATDGAVALPASVLAYTPPKTVVYVSDQGVFAGTPASSD